MILKFALPLAACASLLGNSPSDAHSFRCLTQNTNGDMMMAMADYNPYLEPFGRGALYVASSSGGSQASTSSPELGTIESPIVLGPKSWQFDADLKSQALAITAHDGDMSLSLTRNDAITDSVFARSGDHVAFQAYSPLRRRSPVDSWTKCVFSVDRLNPRDWNMPADFGGNGGWPGN